MRTVNESMAAAQAERRARDVERVEAQSKMETKSAQLASLLMSLRGPRFDTFAAMDSHHQENLLWLAADLAYDVAELMEVAH